MHVKQISEKNVLDSDMSDMTCLTCLTCLTCHTCPTCPNQGHFSEICLLWFQAETGFRIEMWTCQYRQIVLNFAPHLMEIALNAPDLTEKSKKIQNVANFILICFWSEMVLRIELQTRQYHQHVQNFGAELVKQILVQ